MRRRPTTPSIEISRLAQFIGAPTDERDSLLHWRRPAASERTHVYLAIVMCCDALAHGLDRATFLEWATSRLGHLCAGPERRLAIDTIDAFARILSTAALWLEQRGARATRVQVIWAPLEIGGVAVTGGPDMRLEQRVGGKTVATGFLALHASAGFPLDARSACRAARLLYELALANRTAAAPIDPRLCAVVDVFSGVIGSAASAADGVLLEAANACTEVVTSWPRL